MATETKLFTFKLDKKLDEQFTLVAEFKYKTKTAMLREFIISEINKHNKLMKEQAKCQKYS